MMNESNATHMPQIRKGTYRHNKTGKLYEVIGLAIDTEAHTPLVIYRPLYESDDDFELFARPYSMFIESVEINGSIKKRFEYISI